MKLKRRSNGTGSVVKLSGNRSKPYVARILVGYNANGNHIYHDIETFEEEIDALVFLENYKKNPTPIKIKQEKYNKIAVFPAKPFPLVPVENINSTISHKTKKHYTYKQVFEEMKEQLFPTEEERKLEREYHIKPKGKFSYSNTHTMQTAFNNSKFLYDKIYNELRTSDFRECISDVEEKGKTANTIGQLIKLWKNMDKYAYQEDIINKKYTENISYSNASPKKPRKPFTYEQIQYLWDIKSENEKEVFIRDFLLIAIYTGARAEELLFTYTKNIFLENNYFVAGLKTVSGTDREIPIHPLIKPIFNKYYNQENEFLFTQKNNKRFSYRVYNTWYQEFIDKHTTLKGQTAHCARHTLETELQKINIKQTIINSILGHKNGDIGSDVYNHISLEEKLEAIKMVAYKTGKIYILKNENRERKSL